MPTPALLLSHQLGGYDGVSIEAAKWATCLQGFGHEIVRAAGFLQDTQPKDLLLPCLWRPDISSEAPAPTTREVDALTALVTPETLVAVDNLFTYPTAPEGILTVADIVSQARVVLVRHHDAAWEQPDRRGHPAFPLDTQTWQHLAISTHLKENLKTRRGIDATLVFNPIDNNRLLDGNRVEERNRLGIPDGELLFLHPVSPYPRKNILGALEFLVRVAARVGAPVHYWLTGAPNSFEVPNGVVLHLGHARDPADMYAAADAVLLPSLWEGWGNPVAEAGVLGLPVVTGNWPALTDMRGLGLRDVPVKDPDSVDRILHQINTGAPHDSVAMSEALSLARFQQIMTNLLT